METAIPVLAGASSLLATGAVLYRCIRPRFPVNVNCHFCDTTTQVPYGNQNCWDCPTCEQYNGFSEDGDYNKPIPAQFSEEMNHPISAEHRPPAKFPSGSESVICEKCARNQLLKVKQLANFVAYEESNYDAEVEAYQRNLEHLYRLCRDCQKKVDRSLRKQDEFLHRKMSDSGNGSPVRSDVSQHMSPFVTSHFCKLYVPWYVYTLRLLVILCSLSLFIGNVHNLQQRSESSWQPHGTLGAFCSQTADSIYQRSWYLVCAALLMNITAIALAGKESLAGMDVASCFLWLLLVTLHIASEERLLVPYNLLRLQTIMAILTSGVALWCMLGPRYKRAASPTRIRTRRLRPDSSFNSSTSSPFQNVISQDVFHDIISPSSEHAEAGDAEPEPEFLDPIDDLETLSIGEPTALSERELYMDSRTRRVPSTPSGLSSLNSLCHRSIVSPARFTSGQPREPAGSGPPPSHRYVRHHSFGLPKTKNSVSSNQFQPVDQQRPSLFTDNGSVFGTSGGGFINSGSVFGSDGNRSIFANGSSIFGGGSIFDNKSIHGNSGGVHGIKSVHGTRSVNINSGSVQGNGSIPANRSVRGNRSVHSNGGSVPSNRSVSRNNIILNSNHVAGDRASLFSEPHQRRHSSHITDSSGASSDGSFVSQSRASTPCPVDTTFSEVPPPRESTVSGKTPYLSSVLWSLSLLVNLCFLSYFFLYIRDLPLMKGLSGLIWNTSIGSRLGDLLGVPADLLY